MSARRVIAQVLVLAVLVLAQTDTTSASGRDEQRRLAPPNSRVPGVGVDDLRAGVPGRGDAAPRNPKTTTTSPANDCSTVLDAGVLPGAGGILFGDTRGQANDFDACGAGAESAGDEIWEFQVESTGRWTFSTCNSSDNPEGPTNNQWDTILAINEDLSGSIPCPGVGLACNDDAACDAYTCGDRVCANSGVCLGVCSDMTYFCSSDGDCPYGTCDDGSICDVSGEDGVCADDEGWCQSDDHCETGNPCLNITGCDDGSTCVARATCEDEDLDANCNEDGQCAWDWCYGKEECATNDDCVTYPDSACELGTRCGQASIEDVCLEAGTTYYLIVDGWDYQSGGYYGVEYVKTTEACTDDAECDDGDICNGSEECVEGCCVRGPIPCGPTEECPWLPDCHYDPCIAWATDETLSGSFAPQCVNGCAGSRIADDIQLHPGSGRELISYQVYTQAGNVDGAGPECSGTKPPLGLPYDITTDLLDVVFGDIGDGSGPGCYPQNVIDGASCFFEDAGVLHGSPLANISLCEPNMGLPTGIVLPTGDESHTAGHCGVDFYVSVIPNRREVGISLATVEQFLGGPGLDDEFGRSVMMFENCSEPAPGSPLGTFSWGYFDAPTVADARGVIVCTAPLGRCCFPTGGCEMLSELDCANQGGTLAGLTDPSIPLRCEDDDGDPDGDGVYFSCDNCPALANPLQGDCNDDGQGDACEASPDEQDDDNDTVCNDVDPCPMDPNKFVPGTRLGQAPGQCGCGNPDTDRDGDGTADCIDECPDDPYRVVPGVCGCDRPLEEYEDDDNDGFLNCIDTCPNIDDAVFGPCEPGLIPTVSAWGLLTLALFLLVGGKVYFGRRRSADHA